MEIGVQKINLVGRIELLSVNLTESDRQSLSQVMTVRRYHKGELIYASHDQSDTVYFLVEGRVKLYRLSERGRQITLALQYEGDIFGETGLSINNSREEFAEALGNSTILTVPTQAFGTFLLTHPNLCFALTRLMASRLLQSQQQMENLTSKDVIGRLACLVYDMAKHQFDTVVDGVRVRHNLTHEEMGNLVGASRETVTSALSRLSEAGAIVYYPHSRASLIIRNVSHLKACANGHIGSLLPEGFLSPKARRENLRASLPQGELALAG